MIVSEAYVTALIMQNHSNFGLDRQIRKFGYRLSDYKPETNRISDEHINVG
jgi:hypothetical protein